MVMVALSGFLAEREREREREGWRERDRERERERERESHAYVNKDHISEIGVLSQRLFRIYRTII